MFDIQLLLIYLLYLYSVISGECSSAQVYSFMKISEFEDTDSASSSDMDEYESEEEFGDGYPSSRSKSASKTCKPAKNGKAAAATGTGKQPSVGKAKPVLPTKPAVKSKQDNTGKYLGMEEYMQAMDRELAKTTIGKSFVKEGDKVHTWFCMVYLVSKSIIQNIQQVFQSGKSYIANVNLVCHWQK